MADVAGDIAKGAQQTTQAAIQGLVATDPLAFANQAVTLEARRAALEEQRQESQRSQVEFKSKIFQRAFGQTLPLAFGRKGPVKKAVIEQFTREMEILGIPVGDIDKAVLSGEQDENAVKALADFILNANPETQAELADRAKKLGASNLPFMDKALQVAKEAQQARGAEAGIAQKQAAAAKIQAEVADIPAKAERERIKFVTQEAGKLRKELTSSKQIQNLTESLQSVEQIFQLIDTRNPIADQGLINSIVKFFDPGSVVRAGEIKLTLSGRSILTRIFGKIENLQEGFLFTDKVRAQIEETMLDLLPQRLANLRRLKSATLEGAKFAGIPSKQVDVSIKLERNVARSALLRPRFLGAKGAKALKAFKKRNPELFTLGVIGPSLKKIDDLLDNPNTSEADRAALKRTRAGLLKREVQSRGD